MGVTKSVGFCLDDFDGEMWTDAWQEIASDLSVCFGRVSVHIASECDGFEQYCFRISDLAQKAVKELKDGSVDEEELISMAGELEKAAVVLRSAAGA